LRLLTYLPFLSRNIPTRHRPENPVLLAVDQQLGEGAALGVAPELADPVGPLEVGEHEDVEQLGAGSRTEGVENAPVIGDLARPVSWPQATPSYCPPLIHPGDVWAARTAFGSLSHGYRQR
jgi:hypothetical protein